MRKLAIFSCAFAAAVALYVWPLSPLAALLCGAAITAAVLVLCLLRVPQQKRIRIAACGLLAGLVWSWGYQQRSILPRKALCGNGQTVTAQITDAPQRTSYGCRAEASCEGSTVLLYLDKEYQSLSLGDRVTFVGDVVDASDISGDENLYFQARGISLLAFQKGNVTVQKAERTPLRLLPKQAGIAVRERITALFPPQAEGFVRALVTGDKSGLSYRTCNAFSVTGVAHMVAVSGMHVSLLVGLVQLIFRRRHRLTAGISIGVMLFFAAMLGFTPSVMRAVLMNSLLLLAPLFRRENDPATTLSFALLVILLLNPWAIADISLQLSFGAMAGIFLFSAPLYQALMRKAERTRVYRKNLFAARVLGTMALSLAMTLGAMAFTTPLTAAAFETISLISPLSNVLVMFAVSAVFTGCVVAVVLGFVLFPLGQAAAWLLQWPIWLILRVISLLAKVPYAAVYSDSPYILVWLIAAYVLLAALFQTRKQKPLRFTLTVSLLLVVALVLCRFDAKSIGVTAIDVGQGQSVLLQCEQVRVLVDCGGDSGEADGELVARELLMRGELSLDALVLTHYDTDHICGMEQLLSRIEVQMLFLPDISDDSGNREWVLRLAHNAGVPVYLVREDTYLDFQGGSFALYPPQNSNADNDGLVVLMTAGDYHALVLGDMDRNAEQRLLTRCELPQLEVLVAAHHGSKYSTGEALLERIAPEIVIFSVGENTYGHPAQETLDRVAACDALIFRTDLDGDITVSR